DLRPVALALSGAALDLPFWLAATGSLPGWLVALVPALSERAAGTVALALFLGLGLALWLLAAVLAVLRLRARQG
ncbi:MAG: hypothetical protein LPJ95_04155, partial [Paracoccaceae bacterium]|nr:hypothetical protein [Paracoccaceae bacterium]